MKVEEVDGTLIDAVCQRLTGQLSGDDAEQAIRFVRQYYRWVSPDDVADHDELDVYGAALAHFNFARERPPGTPKVRVFNPDFESHGWKSTHTAVEIVTDDMPFLIDSVTMELNRRGFGVHVIIHPVIRVRRDDAGRLVDVLEPDASHGAGIAAESVIHAEVDRQTDPAALEQLQAHLLRVIGEVRAAVEDWKAMRGRALQIAAELGTSPPPLNPADVAEGAAFLEWLADDHFTFLGYREYDLLGDDSDVALRPVAASGLGILRGAGEDQSRRFAQLPAPRARARARAVPAEPHEGELARDRPPARLPRLRRRQALRPRRPGHGRAPLPRALHDDRLPREPARDPDPAPEVRRGARARRLPAGQPQREGADHDPRDPPARRAAADLVRRAVRRRDGDPAPRRAPARAPARAPRRVRAVPLVPRVRAARSLQHREPPADRADPHRGVRRHQQRLRHAHLGVDARAPALHDVHRAGPVSGLRRGRDRGADRRGHALVGRRPRGGARPRARRGARQRPLPPLRRGVPDRLPRRLARAGRAHRHQADRGRSPDPTS